MKNLLLICFVLFSVSLTAQAQTQVQVDTAWSYPITIDTTEIVLTVKVVQGERVIFRPSQPIPLTDRRWDKYYSLCRNIWPTDQAVEKIKQIENNEL